jgi:hypothetical protein
MNFAREKAISFLLGAGFSASVGYPIGNSLNKLLLNSKNENIGFPSEGSLAVNIDGSKPDFGYKSSHQIDFEFCCQLMDYYRSISNDFDYEKFYDYAVTYAFFDKEVEKIAEPFLNGTNSVHSLINGSKKILNQLVSYYLKDGNGNRYYDDQPFEIGKHYQGYSGIMNCISDLSTNSILNIHTLNHDLFFESFNQSDFLNGSVCDGFEELGSPYFGELSVGNRNYKVRIERYTGNYNTSVRLFKLHGSRNYEIFYKSEGGYIIPDIYIKTRYGIGHTDHFKEIKNKKGHLEYQNSWINYHGDFLTGTSSKILRYNEPLLFSKLFEHFKINLEQSDLLVIIGYGAKDMEINKMIFQHYNFAYNKVIIIDPYPSKWLIDFGIKLKAKFISKQLEDINIYDLE